MVKVPKPTPKTFAKTGQMEEISKKKKPEKTLKSNPAKKITESKASVEVASPPAVAENKKTKSKLVKEAIKKATLVKPVKKENIQKKNVEKQEDQPKPKKETKIKQQQKVASPAPKKRPLILAPPESPVVVSEVKKTTKPKATKKKAAAAPATADAAVVAVAPKKLNKKQKKSKAATVTAAKNGTAVAAPKKPKQPQPKLTKMQKKKATKRAFKKQQVKNKRAGKEPKQRRPPSEHTFEPVPFDEDTFHAIVNVTNVQKIAKALKTQVEQEVNEKKTAIFSDYRYHLNVSNFKIPNCPKRMVKLNLKHSLVDKDDDVVIIVADLQRGAKVEYDSTIHHYEDLFREAGVEGLKIIPFNQLRNECNTYEAVRKLANTYDYFLCDGRLVGHVAGFCGKVFQKPRTTFHAVRLDNAKNIKSEVDKALRRTAYRQLQKGDLTAVPVGHHNFTMKQLAENVEHVVEQLKTLFPGGLGNVRSMNLRTDIVGTSSLPIYVSTAQVAPETPYVVGPREQRMLALKKDANEVLGNFNINKDGEFVKLSKTQVERKRKYKEAREVLLATPKAETQTPEDGAEAEAEAAVEESVAEAVVAVPPPAKKARKATKAVKDTPTVVVVKDNKNNKKSKKTAKVVTKQEADAEESD